MGKMQKKWETPQLIVLAKAEPEENVLTSCKTMNPNQPQTGPADFIQQDTCAAGEQGNCSNCRARGMNMS
jgi:hypothetical protein